MEEWTGPLSATAGTAGVTAGVTALLPGGTGLCIHQPVSRRSFRERLRLAGSRTFWRRVLWGSDAAHS